MTLRQRNLKMVVTYDGSAFFGFQFQPGVPTIQGELESVAGRVLGEKVRCIGSGRTDTGVHAMAQVVGVKTSCPIPVEKLYLAMNRSLPGSIRVRSVDEADPGFHPRFSATGKHYRYLIRPVTEPSPFLERYVWQVIESLEVERMQQAAAVFVGTHDFSSFARSPERFEDPRRTILSSAVRREGDVIVYDVVGTGFLHNMVRNMARALVLAGSGKLQIEDVIELLRRQDRRRLGPPAPPAGLYLMEVRYS